MANTTTSQRQIFRRTGWATHVRAVLILLVGIYVLLGAAIWWAQPQLIYHPSRDAIPPREDFITPVRLNTPDGEVLNAWYARAERGCPTILFLDGNAGRPEIQNGRWRRIHEQGVGFLALYYRGYSGSTGTPSEDGLHIDAQAGLSWLVRRGLNPNDVVVHGFSLGSGPATRLAATQPVGALVLEAPFTSMAGLMTEKMPLYPFGLFMRDTYQSDAWITALDEPVLMVHGTADELIPISHSRRLMQLAPEPRELAEIEGADHATLVRDGLYDALWPFLERHWQPSIPPSSRCGLRTEPSQSEAMATMR